MPTFLVVLAHSSTMFHPFRIIVLWREGKKNPLQAVYPREERPGRKKFRRNVVFLFFKKNKKAKIFPELLSAGFLLCEF
jgi:hypothetical protein